MYSHISTHTCTLDMPSQEKLWALKRESHTYPEPMSRGREVECREANRKGQAGRKSKGGAWEKRLHLPGPVSPVGS